MALAETIAPEWTGRIDTRVDAGTKPIDLTYLRRFTLGNRELECEVLGLFAGTARTYLDAMVAATTIKAWHDAAHTLKGSARAVGAWRVARSAEAAERIRFDADHDKRAFILDSAAEALDEALDHIETLRQR
jgi:HPt (histidine-containing phosphotransfer) domain-containing protein